MFLAKIDSWLIDRLEPVMWVVEYFTGKNNFFWARIILVLYLASAYMLAGILSLLIFLPMAVVYYRISFSVESRCKPGLLNSERGGLSKLTRIMLLVGAIILLPLGLVWSSSVIGANGLFFYLIACSPMPPHWRRIKEERRAMRTAHLAPTAT